MEQEMQQVQVLFRDDGRQMVALSSYCGYYLGKTGDLLLTVAAIGNGTVVLHSFKSADLLSGELPTFTAAQTVQVELSYQDMETLIGAYQSYLKVHPVPELLPFSTPGFDPFLVPDES